MPETTKPAARHGGQGRLRTAGNPPRAYHTPKPGGGQFLLWFGGRRVASVDTDHVLRRTLHSSKHLYRGGGEESWSFHAPVIAEARRLGATAIEIKDADTGTIYRIGFDTFLRQARAFVNDWGPQLALPLSAWQVQHPQAARQLSLFGV